MRKTDYWEKPYLLGALVHFYLVNIYGDIPYITNTEYEKNKIAGPELLLQTVSSNII